MAFRVALTFDAEHGDRPAEAGNDVRLLDALAAAAVRATFFVQGRWAEAFPSVARRIAADGHLVGSHTFYHARLPLFTKSGLAADIQDAEAAIVEHAGVDPRPWIRGPFGAGADDPSLISRLGDLGYRHVGWNVNGEDWEPTRTGDDIAASIVAGALQCGDGAVALMHSWPNGTHAAVPGIVARLGEAGATFVSVADLPDPISGIPDDDEQ